MIPRETAHLLHAAEEALGTPELGPETVDVVLRHARRNGDLTGATDLLDRLRCGRGSRTALAAGAMGTPRGIEPPVRDHPGPLF